MPALTGLGGGANCYRWRSWEKRAAAIHRKSEELLSDMVHVLGADDQATDFADNVLAEAEILHSVLGRCAEQSKSPGRRTPSPIAAQETVK